MARGPVYCGITRVALLSCTDYSYGTTRKLSIHRFPTNTRTMNAKIIPLRWKWEAQVGQERVAAVET